MHEGSSAWYRRMPRDRVANALRRERVAFAVHRGALRSAAVPGAQSGSRDTFIHGFMLPFSLVVAIA